jgi:hypothetical protein
MTVLKLRRPRRNPFAAMVGAVTIAIAMQIAAALAR